MHAKSLPYSFCRATKDKAWVQRYDKTPITLTTDTDSRAHRFYLKRGWVGKGWRDEEIELQFTP